jgi:hypothetical protein
LCCKYSLNQTIISMKKHYLLLAGAILAATVQTQAQIKIGGTGAPDGSAMLEVTAGSGNNKGILLPRIALANVAGWGLSGSTPVAGMFIYNTNATVTGGSGVGTYYWDGTQWVKSTGSATSGWTLTGNAGTDPATNFIGTTDAQPFLIRTNNTEKLRIAANGNVGIGVAAPTAQLQLPNILQPRKLVLWNGQSGNANRFFGFGVENLMMRYQVNNTGDDHVFFSGTTDSTSLELMRIKGNGNVGVGTSTPAAKLDVNGTARISGSVPSNTITSITGRDAAGNVGNITIGSGINLSAGTLSVPTPTVQLLKGTLVPNGANVTSSTTGWVSTGATITIPANGTYIVTADMILSTVPIGQPSGSSVPAGESLWVRSSFADSPGGGPSADLAGNNDLMSGTISAGMVFNMLHGAVTLTNPTNAPKTYYYIVGQVVTNGFTPTLYGFGATQWAENQIYAIPIN